MEHKGTTVITSKRLLLRRFVIEDAEAMFHNWASDPEVTRYLTWPAHSSVEVTKMILERIRNLREDQDLTQKQVADYLGVSTPAVHKWEKGGSLR